MKNNYLLILLLITNCLLAQNKFSKLNNNDTGIILSGISIIDINRYQNNINSVYSFKQAYNTITKNDLQKRFNPLEHLNTITKNSKSNNLVNLAILNARYQKIKNTAYNNGSLSVDSNGFLRQNNPEENIYTTNNITILAPLHLSHKGLLVNYYLNEENIFQSSPKTIHEIKIDFNNGEGFKTINKNETITVNYLQKGSKTLTSVISFTDGTSIESKSTIEIKYSNRDLASKFGMAPITFSSINTTAPNLTPYGETNHIGTGEYEIFLGNDNVLDKPIFLIDGFDPGDGRDITGMYNLLNFENNSITSNLGDDLRAQGFDIVILNFPVYTRASDNVEVDGGADFIERNAMLLVELIGIINSQKIGDNKNVIIGPSMGGLISRYALNFMENQNMNHDTRLWLSFDSPHNGANVPIGFQHLFNYMAYGLDLGGLAGDQSIIALRPIVDGMLKSPAARQMLVDHFEPHLSNGSNVDFDNNLKQPIKHPWSDLFYSGLNALTTSGYPENLRKVSLINGSGIGNPYQDKTGADILPNREVINTTISDVALLTDATFRVRFTPYAGQQNITSFLFIDAPFLCFCDLTESATVESPNFTNGVDAASGGLFDIGALSGSLGTDPIINSFFNALETNYFNFIPTISSMALEIINDEPDWFHIPNNLTTSGFTVNNTTPFNAWYMPDNNEPHVTLTTQNVAFAINEIIPSTLGINTNEDQTIKVKENPFNNQIILLSAKTYNNAVVSIIDITGKQIYSIKKNINNETKIPLQLASGLYILNINTSEGLIFKSKIIKN